MEKWDTQKEQKAWREVSLNKRFLNIARGFYVFLKTTRHFFFLHLPLAILVVVLGFYFNISGAEWSSVVFALGLVIIAEMLNTAIEIDIDLTSPEYHPFARDTKDVSAAAVMFSAFVAGIICLIIFLPKVLAVL